MPAGANHTPGSVGARWRAAILLGLVGSTFATVISRLAAPRIGRDPAVASMIEAVVPPRDKALEIEPEGDDRLLIDGRDFSWVLALCPGCFRRHMRLKSRRAGATLRGHPSPWRMR
jgi:hypothetical protein